MENFSQQSTYVKVKVLPAGSAPGSRPRLAPDHPGRSGGVGAAHGRPDGGRLGGHVGEVGAELVHELPALEAVGLLGVDGGHVAGVEHGVEEDVAEAARRQAVLHGA